MNTFTYRYSCHHFLTLVSGDVIFTQPVSGKLLSPHYSYTPDLFAGKKPAVVLPGEFTLYAEFYYPGTAYSPGVTLV